MKIGAQMYTVRQYTRTETEIEKAFERLEQLGFDNVQVSAIGAIEPKKLKDIAEKYHQEIVVTHTDPTRILNDTEKVINEHKLWGCKHVGIGAMPAKYRGSLDGVRAFINDYNEPAKKLNAHGLKLQYHNHAFEFERKSGKLLFDVLVEETAPELWGFILDTYWVQVGGRCPARQIEALNGRIDVCHFKDLKISNGAQTMSTVMDGNLCWTDIIKACRATGIEYAMIEQDDTGEMNPFDALKRSLNNLSEVI